MTVFDYIQGNTREVVLVDGNFSIYQNHLGRSRETEVDYPRVKVVLVDGI